MGHEHLATYLNDHLAGSVVALELLGHLGIEGKRALWLALQAAAVNVLDYELLIKRAEEQRGRVETVRLQTAKLALAPSAEANGRA